MTRTEDDNVIDIVEVHKLREDLKHCKVIIGDLTLENEVLKTAVKILKRDKEKTSS